MPSQQDGRWHGLPGLVRGLFARFGGRIEPTACLVLGLSLLSTANGPSREAAEPVLTEARQVRALTPEQAKRMAPVQIRGVVTYADLAWNMLFIQDSTAGVFVMSSDLRTELPAGRMVEITGLTRAGSYSPVIHRAHVEVLEEGPLPKPQAATFRQLREGKADGYWVEIRGVVGSAQISDGHLMLQVEQDHDWIQACVRSIPTNWPELVNARVRIQGVCTVTADKEQRVTRVQIFVPGGAQVTVEEPAPTDQFMLPLQSIAEALKASSRSNADAPMHLEAGVYSDRPGGAIRLRDRTGAIRFDPVRTNGLKPGLLLDLVGRPSLAGGEPIFREVVSRRIGVLGADEIWGGESAAQAGAKVLTSIEQVRTLPPEEAAKGLPVCFRCLVTYRDEDWGPTFVQALGNGIYVDVGGQRVDLHVGDWIELEGVTTPGEYAPSIARPRFRLLGHAPLPAARTYSLKELSSGSQDSRWVSMEGIVHSVTSDSGHAILQVVEPGGSFEIQIPNLGQSAPTNLVDAKIRAEGVCATIFNQKRQLLGIRLLVPSLDSIKTEQGAPDDPFSVPLRPIGSLLQFTTDDQPDHRVRVCGTVTLNWPGEFAFIQDQSGGLLMKGEALGALKVGDQVEVAGFPAPGQCSPNLTYAICRPAGPGPQPRAVPLRAEQALDAETRKGMFDSRLVRLQGRLLDLTARSKEKMLVLQDGTTVFNAYLKSAEPVAAVLRVGSVVEVAGVCAVQLDVNRNPKSLQLYLRSPADVRVVQSGPWWTLRHTFGVVGLMSATILGAVGWVMALRRRVRTQTALIKQRLQREQALEARYRELFENNPHPMWVYDRESLAFLAVNEAAVHHYGYSREEFLTMTIKDIRPAGEVDALMRNLEATRDAVVKRSSHWKHRKKDGTIIDVETSSHQLVFGGRTAKLVLVNDITERLQRDQELRNAREFLNSVVENLPATVFIKEAQELRFVLWNKAGEQMVGYSKAELMGKNDYDFFPKEEADHFTAKDREALAKGQLVEIPEEVIQTRHQGVRILRTKKIPIFDAGGKPTHLVGISEDITEHKRAQAELERAQKELVEVSREAGMAEVATSVLHNVGNVLNSANVSAALLAEHFRKSKVRNLGKAAALITEHATDLATFLVNDPRGKQLPGYLGQLSEHLLHEQHTALAELESLQKNIEHIKDIVSMQQSYAKVFGVAETVRIADVVEDALRLNAGALQRHSIQVVRQFDELPAFSVERHKVLQILVNLIRNAKYACDESGREDKRLIVRIANGEAKVKISVADNGVGIPAENLTRIFNHGFTTRKDGHGFGLHSGALAAKEMGGELTARSEGPGLGATFTLVLPLTTGN